MSASPNDPPPIDQRFVRALLAEDELGAVIRSHTFVEANLNRYIALCLRRPEFFEDMDLNYARKIDLACALGFDSRYRAALKRLGKIRNDFAHELDATIGKKRVTELYSAMPEAGRKAVQLSYERTKSQLRSSGKTKLTQLEPRDQFVLITLSLERLLMAGILLLEHAKSDGQPCVAADVPQAHR